jgi:hypothetical protein
MLFDVTVLHVRCKLSGECRNFGSSVCWNSRRNSSLRTCGEYFAKSFSACYYYFLKSTVSTKWSDLRNFAFSNEPIPDEEDGNAEENEQAARWNQPFPFDVPAFPVDSLSDSSFNLTDPSANLLPPSAIDPSIPSHLPPFPHSHTYRKLQSSSSSSSSRKRSLNDVNSTSSSSSTTDKRPKNLSVVKSAKASLARLEESADEVAASSSTSHHQQHHRQSNIKQGSTSSTHDTEK